MSYDSSTEAQKVEATRQLTNAAKAMYTAVSGGQHLDSSELDAVIGLAATALAAIGASGTTDTQVIVSNGDSIPIQTSAGTSIAGATAVVVDGVITGAKFAATVTGAKDGQTLAVTDGTVTLHVADGVLTATYAAS